MGIDSKSTSEVSDSLFDAYQTEPSFHFRPKSVSVILDQNRDTAGVLFDTDSDYARAGMADAIVQRLLDDAVDAGLQLLGKLVGYAIGGHIHTDAVISGNFPRLPFERGYQAEVIQHRGTKQ